MVQESHERPPIRSGTRSKNQGGAAARATEADDSAGAQITRLAAQPSPRLSANSAAAPSERAALLTGGFGREIDRLWLGGRAITFSGTVSVC